MGTDPERSVTDADGRCWDIPNLWVCDGSLFPTGGAVNPSLTIQALACRAADRIKAMASRGELEGGGGRHPARPASASGPAGAPLRRATPPVSRAWARAAAKSSVRATVALQAP